MKPREVGGALREAKDVWVWVVFNRYQGFWMPISKAQGREIVDAAKEDGVEVLRVSVEGNEVFIGGDDEVKEEETMPEPPDDVEDDVEEEEEEDFSGASGGEESGEEEEEEGG